MDIFCAESKMYGHDQDAWHTMLDDRNARNNLDSVLSAIPHFPEPERTAILRILAGSSWAEAAQGIYSERSNAGSERLQSSIRNHFCRIIALKDAISRIKDGAKLDQVAFVLGVRSSSRQAVYQYITRWRQVYGI